MFFGSVTQCHGSARSSLRFQFFNCGNQLDVYNLCVVHNILREFSVSPCFGGLSRICNEAATHAAGHACPACRTLVARSQGEQNESDQAVRLILCMRLMRCIACEIGARGAVFTTKYVEEVCIVRRAPGPWPLARNVDVTFRYALIR